MKLNINIADEILIVSRVEDIINISHALEPSYASKHILELISTVLSVDECRKAFIKLLKKSFPQMVFGIRNMTQKELLINHIVIELMSVETSGASSTSYIVKKAIVDFAMSWGEDIDINDYISTSKHSKYSVVNKIINAIVQALMGVLALIDEAKHSVSELKMILGV